jgi:hypothetical protein
MNFLSCCATGKASSTSLQISEIARSIGTRNDDDVVTSMVLHGEVIHDKAIHPRRKNVCAARLY